MGAKVQGPSSGRKGLELNAEPNVIPFVDVMLVLLIIFMVAAPIATVDIEVTLPESKTIPSQRPPKPSYVTVSDNAGVARFYVGNNEAVDPMGLGAMALEEVSRNDPKKAGDLAQIIDERIYIRADGVTRYRNVVFAMNRLQDEGFYKVALVAEDAR